MESKKVYKLIEGIIFSSPNFSDNPNGGYQFTCPFCDNYKEVKNGVHVGMSDIIHEKDCVYLMALELEKDVERSMKLENINKK